jgi:hypothetical protein
VAKFEPATRLVLALGGHIAYAITYATGFEQKGTCLGTGNTLKMQGIFGGRTRTRTLDPLIKSQLLYQLSYAP